MKNKYINSDWEKINKDANKIPDNLYDAIKLDFTNKVMIYRFREALFRNIEGNLGIYLRYIFLRKKFKFIGENVTFWPGIRIKHPWNMEIGNNVQLGYDNHYQASQGIKIGENTIIGPNVNIWTINHIYSDMNKLIKDQGYEKKSVEIGENCWITTKCFILPGAKIPDGCIILPNSVVGIINIPTNSIVGGNPAKVLGKRTIIGKFTKFK